MRLIGLSGKKGSGKSLTACFLAKGYNYVRVSLATPLKTRVREDFGFTDAQVYGADKDVVDARYGVTPRKILIEVGKFYRQFEPNFWLKQLEKYLLSFSQAQVRTFVVDDVRFPNEAVWIRKHGGIMVRLERDPKFRGENLDDESETALDNYMEWDMRVMPYENETGWDAERNAARIHGLLEQRVAHK